MQNTIINLHNISKTYKRYTSAPSFIRNKLFPHNLRGVHVTESLIDISFEVGEGESIAIIGKNGSGKSTLLEIITGTLMPTSGLVDVRGRISALLELGSGFNPLYTGRENAILNGMLLGYTKEKILSKLHLIEDFSELGNAMEKPLYSYSTGMRLRLAFSVQIICEPEILIIDEALSVGDVFFQQKCVRHFQELMAKGVTLLFVSHDMGAVKSICKRGIYLRKGRIVDDGKVSDVVDHYFQDFYQREVPSNGALLHKKVEKADSNCDLQGLESAIWKCDTEASTQDEANILAVWLLNSATQASTTFKMGDEFEVVILFSASKAGRYDLGVALKNRYDLIINTTTSYSLGIDVPTLKIGQKAEYRLKVKANIEAGLYTIDINLGKDLLDSNTGTAVGKKISIGPVEICWDYLTQKAPFLGMVGLPVQARYKKHKAFPPSILIDN